MTMGGGMKYFSYILGFMIYSSSVVAMEGKTKVTLKYGQHSMHKPSQTTEIATSSYECDRFVFYSYDCEEAQTGELDLQVEKRSEQAISLEYETFKTNNYSQSFEFSSFWHKYTASNKPDEEGIVKTGLLSWNFKYTFNTDGFLQPYAGIGLGISYNHFRGPVRGSTLGYILTPRIGFHAASGSVGLTFEVIYVGDTGSDNSFESNTDTGEIAADYNVSGYLASVGIRVGF